MAQFFLAIILSIITHFVRLYLEAEIVLDFLHLPNIKEVGIPAFIPFFYDFISKPLTWLTIVSTAGLWMIFIEAFKRIKSLILGKSNDLTKGTIAKRELDG